MNLNMENSTFFKAATRGSSENTEVATVVTSQGDTMSTTGCREFIEADSVTSCDQMLSGTSPNVFRDKIRLKPSNSYRMRIKGAIEL